MKQRHLLAVFALFASTSGCATIMHGTSQDIGISSMPSGASITVDNLTKAQTPFVASLSRKDNHIVHIAADGFAPADLTLTRGTSGWVWGNIVFGGLVGLAVDAMSGGLYNLTPDQLSTSLAKQSASIAPTKDGIYVILVPKVESGWTKVGQLRPISATSLGE